MEFDRVMKLLLIETSPGLALELEDRLTGAGHEVLTCYDEYGGPCNGITDVHGCPLDAVPDAVILVRPRCADPTLNEAGIVCAQRHHLPVVRVDSPEAEAELGRPGEIESAAVRANRQVEQAYGRIVEAAVSDVDGVVRVERGPRRVAVTVCVQAGPADPVDRHGIADRARAAVRSYDPYVPVIDVAVVVTGDIVPD
jgi:hypothetical protein